MRIYANISACHISTRDVSSPDLQTTHHHATSCLRSIWSLVVRWSGCSDFRAAAMDFGRHQWKEMYIHGFKGTLKAAIAVGGFAAAFYFLKQIHQASVYNTLFSLDDPHACYKLAANSKSFRDDVESGVNSLLPFKKPLYELSKKQIKWLDQMVSKWRNEMESFLLENPHNPKKCSKVLYQEKELVYQINGIISYLQKTFWG